MALRAKHQRFVLEYLKDLNATRAAIRAGYSKKTARVQGSRLLANAAIARAIAEGELRILAKKGISAERVVEEVTGIALEDVPKGKSKRDKLKALELLMKKHGLLIDRKRLEDADGNTLAPAVLVLPANGR